MTYHATSKFEGLLHQTKLSKADGAYSARRGLACRLSLLHQTSIYEPLML
jgi:hypothetical protein